MKFSTVLLIAFGGALGTVARYYLAMAAMPISQTLPVGTILINIVGSFVIGFVGTLTLAQGSYPIPEPWRLFLMVGFCGGFTTFSSFSLQTLDLLRAGGWDRAIVNIAVSVLLCLAAVALGHTLASRMNGHAGQVAQTISEEDA